jgi:NAD(P)-dependent dehydrogenase (short-subunit alcohol dehydrogenase family)
LRRLRKTGANSGIGLETALELARKGWHVTLACRSRERGEAAVQKIKERVPDARVGLMLVDMSSQQSVKDFEREYRKRNAALHLLVNNAGIMLAPHTVTPDLIERTFATNYIGPFLLTNLLLPLLESSSSQPFPSRVVNVGSEAHRWTPAGKKEIKKRLKRTFDKNAQVACSGSWIR